MKALKAVAIFLIWTGLVGCGNSPSSKKPQNNVNELGFVHQQAILRLTGLKSMEFISELSGILSETQLKNLPPEKVAQILDKNFRFVCSDICLVWDKPQGN